MEQQRVAYSQITCEIEGTIMVIKRSGGRHWHHHDAADGRAHRSPRRQDRLFARRGLVPEAGSAWFLPKLVGLPQALRWAISGRVFDAEGQ